MIAHIRIAQAARWSRGWRLFRLALLWTGAPLCAHQIGDPAHDAQAERFVREFGPAACALAARASADPSVEAPLAEMFGRFSPAVRVREEGAHLVVESTGLPAHGMMTGITAWQQQVPLPQPYAGGNAWRIPLRPQPAVERIAIRDRFLRGAIALAANGVPIFNPQNNRGELSFEIGELDHWGGHCGRADDYHYHVAPLHLQETLGRALPIACALDGYPIYGLTEPDGTAPAGLDAFNGHATADLGYHYHASKTYPYVNGGFHGVVVERDGQVDPQPRAQGVRPALTALRGARITGFEGVPGETTSTLRYAVNDREASVTYAALGGGRWRFVFTGPDRTSREEIYAAGDRRNAGEPDRRDGGRKSQGRPSEKAAPRENRGGGGAAEFSPRRTGALALRSPAVGADGVLPVEFTGDGAGISPPLEWSGVPDGVKAFAVVMHHVDPGGQVKWYWTLYNLPAAARRVPADVRDVGTLGNNSVTRRAGYAPPHSKGPGAKTYVITLYALSAPVAVSGRPEAVDRDALLAAMRGLVLDSAELAVSHTRPGDAAGSPAKAGKKGARP